MSYFGAAFTAQTPQEFDSTVESFMVAGRACRKAKLHARQALVAKLEQEKQQLDAQLEMLSKARDEALTRCAQLEGKKAASQLKDDLSPKSSGWSLPSILSPKSKRK